MKRLLLISILFISTMAAIGQEKTNDYTFKQFENKYVVSIKNRAEIVKTLQDFCVDQKIKSGTIIGLGAIDKVTLRFFNPDTKKYADKTFNEQLEISNLTGNISTMGGKEYLHIHITLGRANYTALAGHLLSATLRGAGEFVIEAFYGEVERTFCPNIGLNIYDFEK